MNSKYKAMGHGPSGANGKGSHEGRGGKPNMAGSRAKKSGAHGHKGAHTGTLKRPGYQG